MGMGIETIFAMERLSLQLIPDSRVSKRGASIRRIIFQHHDPLRDHNSWFQHAHVLVHDEAFDLRIAENSLRKGDCGRVRRYNNGDHTNNVASVRQ
jgi:hypothetical protein